MVNQNKEEKCIACTLVQIIKKIIMKTQTNKNRREREREKKKKKKKKKKKE